MNEITNIKFPVFKNLPPSVSIPFLNIVQEKMHLEIDEGVTPKISRTDKSVHVGRIVGAVLRRLQYMDIIVASTENVKCRLYDQMEEKYDWGAFTQGLFLVETFYYFARCILDDVCSLIIYLLPSNSNKPKQSFKHIPQFFQNMGADKKLIDVCKKLIETIKDPRDKLTHSAANPAFDSPSFPSMEVVYGLSPTDWKEFSKDLLEGCREFIDNIFLLFDYLYNHFTCDGELRTKEYQFCIGSFPAKIWNEKHRH
jgi:hypothetical protein